MGDKLVVVDFFSPGCGGCKALHPKLCQLAEMNPDVQFLQVNYEEHKSMCYSLNVHVLLPSSASIEVLMVAYAALAAPMPRYLRNAVNHNHIFNICYTIWMTYIKKFKDALAKHTPERCSLGPTKGLEEKELLALAANKDLNFTYSPKPLQPAHAPANEELATKATPAPLPQLTPKSEVSEERTLTTAGR
ncbi:Thioredoxin-like superfamily [Sesbania bispinosa]|nr:Thioredoxin-like superfamily [Sesbania bispinosa]